MTTQIAPAGSIEIWTASNDRYASNALIGYIVEADCPDGQWIAALPDLDDIMHDPQPIKTWKTARSAEAAEVVVRTHYTRWVTKRD
jgi:hypothetical protein